jgi:hypothetical protein
VKTAFLTLVFGGPALALLRSVWRTSRQRTPRSAIKAVLWIAKIFFVSYLGWVLNVTLGWSAGAMVLWPLLGIGLSIAGFVLGAFAESGQRLKLLAAYVLLLILSLSSIVMPN